MRNTLFTDVMTIYNYHEDAETGEQSWHRNIVKGVQWSHSKVETNISGGVQTETKVESITVDFDREYGNKTYIDPISYSKLSSEEISDYWTLNAKCGQEMLVQGISDKEITDEYPISSLIEDFQYVGTIISVSDNRNRRFLQTIKVVVQ